MSTERQQKGDSLRRQLDWSAAFSERNNLVLDDSLRDIGVSAWKGKHRKKGALGEFLRMVEEGLIPRGSYLLIESLDRLSREQVMDALDLFRSILRQGITIATMDPEQVYTLESVNREFSQLLIALTFMSRANEESERKSSRIKQAFRTKREQAALGKKTNSAVPSWITAVRESRDTFTYVLNDNVHTVRRIFEMSADGMGVDAISRALNRDAVPTFRPSARGWWPTKVNNVLTSRSAIGELQHTELVGDTRQSSGDAIPNYYPAAVSAELFLRAQKQPGRRKAGRTGETFTNLLGDMARCVHCGARMFFRNGGTSRTVPPKSYNYLTCSVGARDGDCKGGSFTYRYDQVEGRILDHVAEFGFSDVLQAQASNQQLNALDRQLAEATVAVDLARNREARLLAAIESDEGEAVAVLVGQLNKRVQEREQAELDRTTLQRARDMMAVQQGNEDPTYLIQSLRAEWLGTDDNALRYRLRSRCHSAMSKVIDQVDFDRFTNSFTVVLFGGLRAYRFHMDGGAADTPRVVDMMGLRSDLVAPLDEALRVLAAVPVSQPINDRRQR